MTREPKRPSVVAPEGVTPTIATEAKRRRRNQRGLLQVEGLASRPRNDLAPSLQLKVIPIDELRPAPRRVRKSETAQVARVKASIQHYGYCAPILVDGKGQIVHGHVVWEAARGLGIRELPCVVIDHLSADEIRRLRISLNRLAETGTWDVEGLRLEFKELIVLDEDADFIGFESVEVDMFLLDEDEPGDAARDELPDRPLRSVSQKGDIWVLGLHRLVHGDALDAQTYERIFDASEQARLLLTDVPYNVPTKGHVSTTSRHCDFAMAAGEMSAPQFAAFNKTWMDLGSRRIADGGLIGTTIDWRSVEQIISTGRSLGLELLNVIVWVKSNAGQGSLWRSAHELLPMFKKGQAPHVNNVALGRYGRWRSNVWEYPGASSLGSDARNGLAIHPTVKPRAMLEDALLDVTKRGEIVLDCFAGSGSMLVAAEAVGRRCRAIEIDGPYCDVIIRRWEKMTGQSAVLQATGETFKRTAEQLLCGDAEGEVSWQ